jgi:hypothetical protein
MNYEEMLNAQDGVASHKEELPLGVFYKKKIDRKYRNVLELKPLLIDNIAFCEGLKKDQQVTAGFVSGQQLHYELHEDSSGVYELEVEQGNYQTFAQLIDATPSVLARQGFIERTIKRLIEVSAQWHEQGVFYLCYAPQNVFARKADNEPMLLCHGSSFAAMSDLTSLYEGFESFVAPEVIAHEGMDERSDVYSLGKFIEWIYEQGDMPYEYKKVVKKATMEDPEQRYLTMEAMRQALVRQKGLKRSVLSLAAALLLALLVVGLFFELMPKTTPVEFVEGVEKEASEDYLDDGFNPETELGVWYEGIDVDDTLQPEERKQLEDYQSKAEELFRKQFTREAERVLSKIYSKDRMGLSERSFIASNNAMASELLKTQGELAGKAGIPSDRADHIAAEIVEKLTREKQKGVNKYGFQRGDSQSEE